MNELALESEERRQSVVARLQRLYFLGNSKQVAQEILDMRRERDHQLGLLLGRPGFRSHARIKKLDVQAGIGR